MALRRLLGCLPVAALAMSAGPACKGSGDGAKASAADLDKRCELLAKTCGDKDKHVEKILEECKQAAKSQLEKGCADKAIAAYSCYENELCGIDEKVWTIADLEVLAKRHGKCVAQQDALRACAEKK